MYVDVDYSEWHRGMKISTESIILIFIKVERLYDYIITTRSGWT